MKDDKYMLMNVTVLLRELDNKIQWHDQNRNDPYNIDITAIAILTEIKDCFTKAIDEK